MGKLDTNAVFTQYVNVMNKAIGQHRDNFPYKQFLSLGEDKLEGKKMTVAVYGDDPDNPHDYFTVKFDNGTFGLVQHGKSEDSSITWKAKESYLRNVIKNPDEYIEHPAKLDFDWLKSRLNIA